MLRIRSKKTVFLPSGAKAIKDEVCSIEDSDARLMIKCKLEFDIIEDESTEDNLVVKVTPVVKVKKKKNVSNNNS